MAAKTAAMLAAVLVIWAGAAEAAKKPKPSDRHYQHAIELIAAGDHQGGIVELQNALEADPTDLAARVLLGNTYLEIEDGIAAADEFLRARKDGARDSFILVPLARAYVLQGRYEDALKELSRAKERQSIAAEVAATKGAAHFALRQYDDAEKQFLAALKIRPKYSIAFDGLAQIRIANDDLAGAETYVERALEARPKDSQAWFAKGEIARLRGRENEALAHYDRSVELAPKLVPPRLARARILVDRGEYGKAEPDVSVIRAHDAKSPYGAFLQALVLAEKGRVKEARTALLEAETNLNEIPAKLRSSDAPTQFLLGVIAYFRKDYTAAYRYLTGYLKDHPRDPDALKLLASQALASGDSDYALHLLEGLAPRNPDDVEIQSLFADALMRAKRHREAVAVLEKTSSVANPPYPALSRLVMLRAVAGQNATARKLLKSEMIANPQAVKASLLMAATQLNQREYALAFETAASVIELDSRNAVAHNLAGGALVGLKDFDAARSSFRTAFEAAPKYELAVSNLARLEFRLGNLAAAERLYTYMVEQDSRDGAAMIALAEIELLRDDLDGALHWLENARAKSRSPGVAALHLVDHYIYAGKPENALAVAHDLNSQDPTNLRYLTALGRARLATNRAALAAVTFKEIAVRAAEKKSAGWLVRNAVWQMRSFDERGARDSLEKALELDNSNLSAHVAAFRLEMAAGKIEAAESRARKIAGLDKQSPLGEMLLGDAYMRAAKYEAARATYDAALNKGQEFAQAVRAYRARREAGGDALAFAEGRSGQFPSDRSAQRLLAMAYGDAGRGEDAVAVYNRLVESAPRDTALLTDIAVQVQRHDPARALEIAEQAFRAAPADPVVMDTYGWILVQQGSLDEGLTLLRKAKLRAPSVPAIRYHIAVALDKLGNQDESLRELHAALRTGQSFDGDTTARQLLGKLSAPPRQ